ncbi:hypothetical protein GCM10009678_56710 [Actinomadura kijaniata]|uniref:Uncharacterized protein n=1 Tax=Actinomadura namibiensis TaxID=182080 RepID=A0A7W3LL65_ACTNM|nr:hypothetical protein [Actinomadura namibiensis]MBA8950108.1 hypothetical protein [Actinomadura namibiensis]
MLYVREQAANSTLTASAIAPLMPWSSIGNGWVVMLFDHLNGRDADLSPGSPDLPQVVTLLERLGSLPTWEDAPPAARNVEAPTEKANALLNRQTDGEHREMRAQALDRYDLDARARAAEAGRAWIRYRTH